MPAFMAAAAIVGSDKSAARASSSHRGRLPPSRAVTGSHPLPGTTTPAPPAPCGALRAGRPPLGPLTARLAPAGVVISLRRLARLPAALSLAGSADDGQGASRPVLDLVTPDDQLVVQHRPELGPAGMAGDAGGL